MMTLKSRKNKTEKQVCEEHKLSWERKVLDAIKSIYKPLALLVLLCSGQQAMTQNFITQWNLGTAGSGATQLSFGTATSGIVNYTWQEISPGTASGSGSWSGAILTITGLPTGSTIRLQIAPTNFQRIIINLGSDRSRLTQVEQWGSTAWTSMQNAFRGCANLQVTATDVPDLSGASDMSAMFSSCTKLNSPGNINSWNTSTVTNMSGMFSLASAFNQNISSWNTGTVTNMSNLFADAAAFNQDIGVWSTAAVTNMAGMFAGALIFNRNIGAWNTAAVTDMNSMFFSAYVFNQNISGWNTAAVTNMSSMFGYAYDFNQNIGTWNTSAVINMSRMFEDAFDFNQNIGAWNTSAVTNMRGMFIDAYAFNQNIGTWNTSAVTDMSRMFDFATAFNQNIGAWNTAAVTNMSGMFADASAFNQNIGTWSLNSGVLLTGMLNNSGINCNNYSATLLGWSANPSTPNGRALGAIGRQYGTNAVAARTNLTTTKGWTITGDTPSGFVCGSVLLPTITSFTPTSGPIGTTVTITGTNFSTTLASNIVYFGATRAVVTAATSTQLTVTVPKGATYQPISVEVNGSIAYSSKSFAVTFANGGVIDACAFEPKKDFATGIGPQSISLGDVDGDGKADMVVTNVFDNNLSVLRNTTTGSANISYAARVSFTTGTRPASVTLGDLDGDGKLDLAVANETSNTISVFRNTSSGVGNISFASKIDFATATRPMAVSIGDFDKDGKTDLVSVNRNSSSISVFRNTSTGVGNINYATKVDFTTGTGVQSVATADFDSDGKLDVVVTNESDFTISIFRNTSSGTGNINYATKVDFTTGPNPIWVATGDLDGDGKTDVAAVTSDNGSISVLRNTSSGVGNINYDTMIEFTTGSAYSVSISDIDGDGNIDLAAGNSTGTVSILRNTSSGIGNINYGFITDFITGASPQSVAIGDVDGDGKNDLAVSNSGSDNISVLRNNVSSLPPFTSSGFTPTTGPVGTAVTFTGTNFSTTPLNNTIKFNGVTALVTASSSTSITAIVPMGATTGPVSIQIGCITAISIFPFTVTAGSSIAITTQPADLNVCINDIASFTTSATGTTNITYQWQFSPNTGTFSDINNGSSFSGVTTATLSVNTANSFGAGQYRCRINGDLATQVITNSATLSITNCGNNQPPVIVSETTSVLIEGVVTIDLVPLISDPDDNLNLQSLQLVNTVSEAGASASISTSFELTLDYGGVLFSETDFITISVCDLLNDCIEQELSIEVAGDIIVYNAISPNSDDKNEILYLKYIDVIPEKQNNIVSIYNRWGSKVFEVDNYNNDDRVFKGLSDNGNELPSGTYFYKIVFPSNQEKEKTGYLVLKR